MKREESLWTVEGEEGRNIALPREHYSQRPGGWRGVRSGNAANARSCIGRAEQAEDSLNCIRPKPPGSAGPWRCKQSHSPAKLEAVGKYDQAGWNLVFSVSIGWWKVFRSDSDCMTRDS